MSVKSRFSLRLRGYSRSQVDAELHERDLEIGVLVKQLESTRRELRYWHDRQAFVDIELERAREEAARMLADATERANTLEHQAQERTLKMVDRVCNEAHEVMRNARDESQAITQRYHDDVERAQQRLADTSGMQRDVVVAMRAAMSRFEEGMHDLELVTPSTLIAKHPTTPRIALTAGTSTATLTETLDTRKQLSLGQSATALAVSAAQNGSPDPALETLRLMIEGAPATSP